MTMPLVMLGASYDRYPRQFIAADAIDTSDPYWYEGAIASGMTPSQALAQSGSKPGSFDWNQLLDTAIKTGGSVLHDFLYTSNKIAVTPEEKAIVQSTAAQHGITLGEAAPWLIGGAALLVVVVLLMSKGRRR